MDRYRWDDSLELDVLEMDREHKILITYMNEIYNKNKTRESKQEVLSPLNKLLNYAKHHFSHEESYMESISYPQLEEHKAVHRDLLMQLESNIKRFSESKDQHLSDNFFYFLEVWLFSHIRTKDKRYSQFGENRQP